MRSELSARFPAIKSLLGDWIDQLTRIREADEYAALVSELESPEDSGFGEHVPLLDAHLKEACDTCSNLPDLLKEKPKLPKQLDEANITVLNKLSEIRAVVGLSRLGFSSIEFSGTPDLIASKGAKRAAIEVTRLGRSEGKRSDVWDWEAGGTDPESLEETGYHIGLMSQGKKVTEALWDAIYREIEEKYRQVRDVEADLLIIWISLGRDYLTCSQHELEGIGLFKTMRGTQEETAALAIQSHLAAGLCKRLTHVVISPGRDLPDLFIKTRADDR